MSPAIRGGAQRSCLAGLDVRHANPHRRRRRQYQVGYILLLGAGMAEDLYLAEKGIGNSNGGRVRSQRAARPRRRLSKFSAISLELQAGDWPGFRGPRPR